LWVSPRTPNTYTFHTHFVFVCVCEREGEREGESEREREFVCVCTPERGGSRCELRELMKRDTQVDAPVTLLCDAQRNIRLQMRAATPHI
jgi:hypothetical protein